MLWILLRLPRMRGDRPLEHLQIRKGFLFTPHARGSTAGWDYMHPLECVYPACAGIDPTSPKVIAICAFTPHARGST